MSLAGITLVANGVELGYPFEACVRNLAECCDHVFVHTEKNNRDDTLIRLKEIQAEYEHITIGGSNWNWGITRGADLAHRANLALKHAKERFSHALYVQADEIVDPEQIRRFPLGSYSYMLERLYFWKNLSHVNRTWTCYLPRLVPLTPQVEVITDGMFMKTDPIFPCVHVDPEAARIYHYSRVGNSRKIAERLNNLDSLFHQQFQPLEDYEFGINNNFETGVDTAEIVQVNVKHPPGVKEFYGV